MNKGIEGNPLMIPNDEIGILQHQEIVIKAMGLTETEFIICIMFVLHLYIHINMSPFFSTQPWQWLVSTG